MITLIFAAVFLVALWGISLWLGVALWIAAAITVGLVLALAGAFLYKRARAAKATKEIERSLANQARAFEKRARPDQQAEVQALAQSFEKAMSTLKSSKLAKGQGGALYALPWYVIIGPPGAGKSTAIRQSGLKFPMMGGQGSVRGIGGTRNCDWWLTNEAVLLDTAGRYATEDDDRGEWLEFLDMLRRARPKRPLNGLIVAVSIADVAAAGDSALEALAQRIRERVDEVMGRLGIVLPVYVLLTKCDLVPGFVESFEDLRKNERSQVFGFTFPFAAKGDLATRVDEQWTRLVQVVERRGIMRLAETRGAEARHLVYEFPQQLEALRANVITLLNLTFVDNVYQDAPLVRGVYLTSGTQEGSPIDRLMSSMAAAFGLTPRVSALAQRSDVKSYFLGELFTNVMFPDQEVAARNTATQQRMQWLRFAAACALILGAIGLSAFPVGAYVRNRDLMVTAQQHLASAIAYRSGEKKKPVPLSVLEPIREELASLQNWEVEGAPTSYQMGLYQGGSLLPRLRTFYVSTLRSVLMQPIVDALEDEMRQTVQANESLGRVPSVHDHARLYEQTRAYLLLTVPKEPSQPLQNDMLRKWLIEELVDAWAQPEGKPPSPAERAAMSSHLDAYLALFAEDPKLGFARDGELVRRSRELLARVPTVRLAIDRVVAELDKLGWDVGLDQLVGASGLPVTATGRVRGAFTRRAWDEYVRGLLSSLPEELLGDPWVLEASAKDSSDETTEARLCALRSEYFGRYVDEWKGFLGTLRVEEPADHARALVVLQDLTRGQPPPLERIMRSVAYNAQLGAEKKEKTDAEKAVESTGMLDRLRDAVQKSPVAALLAKKDPCGGGSYFTEVNARRALEGFFTFGATLDEPQPGAPAQFTPVQVYQEQLVFVRDALQTYVDDPTTAEPLLARLQAARTRVRSLIETQEVGYRPRFDAMLWPPINGASSSSTSALAGEKGSQWCTSVVLPFARTLQDRYPFSKQGQDAALADVLEFYRPQSGIVWTFYESSLKRDVPQVGGKFELAQGTTVGSMYTNELVRFLNRSYYLSSVLFPPRAEKPRVDFEVRVRPSPGIAQVLLTIDGQLVDFHNGPEKWVRITWPGESGKPGANMRVKGAKIDELITQDGEWGLFRLLDKGTISANPNERFFTVRFRLHTQNDITIDVRPARAENPFVGSRAYLEAFRTEGVLAPRTIAQGAKACPE
jgi:type VI secretion system protein ImpL